MTPSPCGLAAHEARLAQDLAWLELPAKSWVPPRTHHGRPVIDVVIIGAGMCGLAAAWGLKRLGIGNIVLLDRAPAGCEGPWVTFARMQTLRSPKQLTGPAMGLPALTFRAWFEAQFGTQAWDDMGKIPRTQWMEYLIWYRRVLDLPVQNDTEVTAVQPLGPDLMDLTIRRGDRTDTILARRLILATGRDGLGAPWTPPELVTGLDRRFWAHSADEIDFDALAGKRIGVIGAGASAMDNAATALEKGAASVDMFIRRKDIPRVNKFTGIGSQGVVHGFQGLPDIWKWRFLEYTLSEQTPPPRDSTLRVSRHPQGRFHLGSPIRHLSVVDGALRVQTPKITATVDFLIFATGFQLALHARPELSAIAGHIRLWRDRFPAPPGLDNMELATSPDLGPSFEFLEKTPGACPMLAHIHCFNFPATLSHGKLSGDIPAVSEGADRLSRGIARSLFVEDRETHFENLIAFDTPELHGDEWTDADAAADSTVAAEA